MSDDTTLDELADTEAEENEKESRITGLGTFPSDWDIERITQCADIRDRERIPLNSQEREKKKPGQIPYYGANGVMDYINEHIFDSELILLAEDGGHFEEYQERPVAYRISGKSWVNNHAHILEAKSRVVTDYLFYSLEHRNLVPYVSGSTRSKLTQTMLKKVEVPVPPISEQRKIATVLDTVDQAIQKTEKIIDSIKQTKRGVLQDTIFDVESKESVDKRFGPKIFNIPEYWQRVRLQEVTELISRGKQPTYADDGVPVINQECIYWDGFRFENLRHLEDEKAEGWKNKYFASDGNVLINSTGRGTLGRAQTYTDDIERAVDSHVTIVQPDTMRMTAGYLRYFLESNRGQGLLYSMCVTGSTGQIELSKSKLQLLSIPLPPLEEQKELVNTLKRFDSNIRSQQEYKEQLSVIKRGLVQELISGEVRTTDADIDPPEGVAKYG